MAEEDFLDLPRVDVRAAGDDHVLRAVADGEETGGIHAADISRMQPAAAQRLLRRLRVLPVARHHAIRARDDLAELSRGQLAVLGIEDLHFAAGARETAGFQMALLSMKRLRQPR